MLSKKAGACAYLVIANKQQWGRGLVKLLQHTKFASHTLSMEPSSQGCGSGPTPHSASAFTNKPGRNRRGKRDTLSAMGWLRENIGFLKTNPALGGLGLPVKSLGTAAEVHDLGCKHCSGRQEDTFSLFNLHLPTVPTLRCSEAPFKHQDG